MHATHAHRARNLFIWSLGLLVTALALADPSFAKRTTTERVSLGSDGAQGNGYSAIAAISAHGRFVAFQAYASTLVEGDTNGDTDVFVHDRRTGATERVSVGSRGVQANDESFNPSISANGRFVSFASAASNLVRNDTNNWYDVFVHDRRTGETERVSVSSGGTQGNFTSFDSAISANGRYVAVASSASNLAPHDTNGQDIFVHDRKTGETERVSNNSSGVNGSFDPSISADGRRLAFFSYASDLVEGDTNDATDVFVHDRKTRKTERVSVGSGGAEGDGDSFYPFISARGRFVSFASAASNLVGNDTNGKRDVFVHDLKTGETERVSVGSRGVQGNDDSFYGSISANGRFVAFDSAASNLVHGDTNGATDVFIRDRKTGETERVSLSSHGVQGAGSSGGSSISANGRFLAFGSSASNLVVGDTNDDEDVFVRGPLR
jgi:tricorn protease-like protein